MSKAQELPRGLQYRDKNIVAVFALADGTIERRSLGQKSIPDAEADLILFKQAVRNGTYQKRQKKQKTAKPTPAAAEAPVLVRDLWAGYKQNYINEGGRDLGRQVIAWKRLQPTFGAVPVVDVTTKLCRDYIALRQSLKISGGTINRELSILKSMFNLGMEDTTAGVSPMVTRIPAWPRKLAEGKARKGFFTDEKVVAIQSHAKFWLRAFIEVDSSFGFRKGELLNLLVEQCDLLERLIRLDEDTKTNEARTVPMTERVFQYLVAMCRGKGPSDYVFTREDGGHVVDMRDDWQAACVAAGLGKFVATKGKNGPYPKYFGPFVHDFRRSALRRFRRNGTPDTIGMKITGHKTRSTYDRYDIPDTPDLQKAARDVENSRTMVFDDPQLNDANFTATASKPN
jgi:integrase